MTVLRGAVGAVLVVATAVVATAEPAFVERTSEVGLDFVHFNGMSGELYFVEMVGAGVALLDYDGDGDLDLYAVQGRMLGEGRSVADATFPPRHREPFTDRLYRNDASAGRFTLVDVTGRALIDGGGYGMGVASGDLDNDGDTDLYLANWGRNQVARNLGDGTFAYEDEPPGTRVTDWSVSASFADVDHDGWLDLYLANYVDYRMATHKQCKSDVGTDDYCGPLAFPPLEDVLYRNGGDGNLVDESEQRGVAGVAGSTLGVVAADFNADGRADLYAANDQVANFLWINRGDGTFVDDAVLAGAAVNAEGQPEASMGVVAADFDGDGHEDLLVTHLVRETNTLYLNDGGGFFHDATQGSGLGRPSFRSTGFGVASLDYDGDGELDLYVANGAVRRMEEQLRRGEPHPLRQPNHLYRNIGGGRFEDRSADLRLEDDRDEVSRGVATGDLDNDGDPDLVVTQNAGPARLLINERLAPGGRAAEGGQRAWLGVRATIQIGGRDALGARVTVETDGSTVVRRVRTDGSYVSAVDPRLQIGVDAASVERLSIEWPSGARSAYGRPAVGRYLVVAAPAGAER